MGWKNLKEHYRITHIVQVTDKGICIGSGYVHDLMIVGLDGTLTKRYERAGNEDLARYQREMDADPQLLRRLITSPDTFTKSIPVYTYDGAAILEKQCEELGWPNVTHDGEVMYENTHYADKAKAVQRAKANARAAVALTQRARDRLRQELAECEQELERHAADVARLDADHPEVTA